MKRKNALLLALLLTLSAFAGCGREEQVDRFVTIGVFEPATGDDALYGNQELLGIKYARTVKQDAIINGEKYTVRLSVKDTKSKIYGSVYAARELTDEMVSIAIGTYGSSACNVAATEFAKAGISAIGVTCTDPNVTVGNGNFYRVCYIDDYQAKLLAQYAYESGARKVYCLAQKDRTYDREMCDAFIKEFKALGGTVITSVVEVEYNTYSTSLNDFADYINGAVNNKADMMFAPIPTKKGAQLVKECAAADVRFSILGDDGWDDDTVAEAGMGSYLYVSCATVFSEERDTASAEFAQGFRDWLHADPKRIEANGGTDTVSAASALGYDAYMAAVNAIEIANSTEPQAVSLAVPQVSVEGVTGHIVFDENGDLAKTDLFIRNANQVEGVFRFEKVQQLRWDTAPTPTPGA